jgi:hypothetical protein
MLARRAHRNARHAGERERHATPGRFMRLTPSRPATARFPAINALRRQHSIRILSRAHLDARLDYQQLD